MNKASARSSRVGEQRGLNIGLVEMNVGETGADLGIESSCCLLSGSPLWRRRKFKLQLWKPGRPC